MSTGDDVYASLVFSDFLLEELRPSRDWSPLFPYRPSRFNEKYVRRDAAFTEVDHGWDATYRPKDFWRCECGKTHQEHEEESYDY